MKRSILMAVFGTFIITGSSVIAIADRHRERGEREERGVSAITDPIVLKECGACHMAFQPEFLPTGSWVAIMSNLKDHFGDNATLDAATTEKITAYLTANASDVALTQPIRGADMPKRITELPWFKNEHGRRGRSSPEALKRAGAKSMADCKACHKGADKGYFDDD